MKYFYIKEKVYNGKIAIKHFPTEQMWMEINTKPKQGAVFCAFRGHVMGIPSEYNDKYYQGMVKSIPPIDLMPPVPRTQKELKEFVDKNGKEPKCWFESTNQNS